MVHAPEQTRADPNSTGVVEEDREGWEWGVVGESDPRGASSTAVVHDVFHTPSQANYADMR